MQIQKNYSQETHNEILRTINDFKNKNKSLKEVAEDLNSRGIKPARGKKFTASVMYSFIQRIARRKDFPIKRRGPKPKSKEPYAVQLPMGVIEPEKKSNLIFVMGNAESIADLIGRIQ